MSKADNSLERPKRKIPLGATVAIVSVMAVVLYVCLFHVVPYRNRQLHSDDSACRTNLNCLGKAILVWNTDSDEYPPADRWCDILKENDYARKQDYRCPGDKVGPCSYAMNKYVVELGMGMGTPTDLLLLFESEPGWNRVGGPEVLTTKYHGGKGCHVLFCDFHVEFVPSNKLELLKWKAEQAGQ
jgi:prepilin-type processing-associated H-X9-DG protein